MSFSTPCSRFLRRPSAVVSVSSEYKPPSPACFKRPIIPTSILFSARHLCCPRSTPSPRGAPSRLTTCPPPFKTLITHHHVAPKQVAPRPHSRCRPQDAHRPSSRDQPRSTPSTTWTSQRPRVDYLVKYLSSHYIFFSSLCQLFYIFVYPQCFFFLLCISSTWALFPHDV